ncbi:hypothetical protein IJ732_00310, partial [bacterium]|nr:hypothetical protein [bacterium]
DTNGDKRPNSAGKDRYRMLVTDHGLIAHGESEYCGTIDGGLDCGKYILTYHKLFDGLINNCTAYDNGECSQCENGYQNNGTSCRDIRENTCDTYSGTTCTKCTTENLLAAGDCIAASTQNCVETDGLSTCTKCSDGNVFKDNVTGNDCVAGKIIKQGNNETTAYKVGEYYVAEPTQSYQPTVSSTTVDFVDGAENYCTSLGMHLPSLSEMQEIYENKYQQPGLNLNAVSTSYFTSDRVPNSNFQYVYNMTTGVDATDGRNVCYYNDGSWDTNCVNTYQNVSKRPILCVE